MVYYTAVSVTDSESRSEVTGGEVSFLRKEWLQGRHLMCRGSKQSLLRAKPYSLFISLTKVVPGKMQHEPCLHYIPSDTLYHQG